MAGRNARGVHLRRAFVVIQISPRSRAVAHLAAMIKTWLALRNWKPPFERTGSPSPRSRSPKSNGSAHSSPRSSRWTPGRTWPSSTTRSVSIAAGERSAGSWSSAPRASAPWAAVARRSTSCTGSRAAIGGWRVRCSTSRQQRRGRSCATSSSRPSTPCGSGGSRRWATWARCATARAWSPRPWPVISRPVPPDLLDPAPAALHPHPRRRSGERRAVLGPQPPAVRPGAC